MTSAVSSSYIGVISICAPLEKTAEEKYSRRDLGKPSSKLIFDMGQSSGLQSMCSGTKSTHFCLFLRECTAGFVPFILTSVKSEKLSYSFRRLGTSSTSGISLFYDALLMPRSSFPFLCVKKQHGHFAKLLDSCVWIRPGWVEDRNTSPASHCVFFIMKHTVHQLQEDEAKCINSMWWADDDER